MKQVSKKTVCFFLSFLLFCTFSLPHAKASQYNFSEKEAQELLHKVADAASKFENLSAKFKQDKHLNFMQEAITTEGFFYFANRKDHFTLIWEYLTPAISGILYSNSKVLLWNESRENAHIPSSQEEPFVKIMAKELIFWMDLNVEEVYTKYHVEMISENSVLLKPKQEDIFESVSLTFSLEGYFLKEIKLDEGEGNYIKLTFFDVDENVILTDDFAW